MDKETLSNYGWIVICVLVLAVMIALATPFGEFISGAVKSTTQGLFDVNQNALNSTGLINIDRQEFESCEHDYEVTTTANCTTAGTTTHTCKLCGKTYSEETPAGHTWDDTGLTCTECGATVIEYAFKASDYDKKMGTTTKTDTNVVIPETFEYNGQTYKVTSIDLYSFSGCTSLTSITIPDGVISIDYRAFYNCSNLTSIILPKGLTSIGSSAFNGCTNLAITSLPEGLTSIGDSAFSGCTNLAITSLPEGLTSITGGAFIGCTGLTSITLHEGVTRIEPYTFSGCTNLTSITIPERATSIGNNALEYCTSLTSINYAGTVDEWSNITLGENWNTNIPATYVQCSDGQVPLS